MSKFIAFRLSAGKRFGLGHLIRLINISRSLKSKPFWIIESDYGKISNFFHNKKTKLYIKKKISENIVVKKIKKLGIKKIVFDLPDNNNKNKKKIISQYSSLNLKTISYDLPTKYSDADVKIIPYITNKKINQKNTFVGSQYLGIKFKKNRLNKIKNILISISGSDKFDIGNTIYNILKKYNFNITFIHGLNKKPSSITKKCCIKKFAYNLKELISYNDLIITGEGMTKYDVIYENKPLIIIQQFNNSQLMQDFKSKRLCLIIKKNLKKDIVEKKIISFVNNNKLLKKFHKNQINLLKKNSNLYEYKKMLNTINCL
jgi:spore coat polysaccharide biosynthesis predicted glycosyltransferase SpsG